jgi:hypothetical protein
LSPVKIQPDEDDYIGSKSMSKLINKYSQAELIEKSNQEDSSSISTIVQSLKIYEETAIYLYGNGDSKHVFIILFSLLLMLLVKVRISSPILKEFQRKKKVNITKNDTPFVRLLV